MQTDIQILIAHLLFYSSVYISFKFIKIRIKSKAIKSNQRALTLFLLAVIMVIPFLITFKTHINLRNFLLKDIYETRLVQRELNSIYLGYTYSWLAKIIIPTALIYSIAKGLKAKSLILFILLAYLFLVGAHKSVFFGTFVYYNFLLHSTKISKLIN